MAKLHTCRWSHCRHDNKTIEPDDEVKIGAAYYHKDCAEEKSTIDRIIQVWSEKIDAFVQIPKLRSIVNQVIYTRGCDPKFILYVVECGAKEHWLKHEAGLYTAVKDEKRYAEWKRGEAKKYLAKQKPIEPPQEQTFVKYTYQPSKEKSIADIFS